MNVLGHWAWVVALITAAALVHPAFAVAAIVATLGLAGSAYGEGWDDSRTDAARKILDAVEEAKKGRGW